MIYLYDSTETDFRYNGKPLPTAYDVTVSNTLNGEYYVMGKYPLDKDKVYKGIVEDRIIKVHTMDGMQPFRIVNVSKYELYVEFEAWPLFYADMRNKLVKPLNLKGVSGQTALNAFKNNLLIDTPFDFYSDITSNHDYHTQDENERENNPKQLYNALDVFKTIVNRWGGELWIRGYDIRVNKRIGTDTEAMLYEKKNITEFVDTTNIEGIVTRLHGKSEWQDERQEGEEEGQKHSIEVTVDSPLINNYSGVVFEKQFTNNDIRTEQELKKWLNLKFTTENIDKPQRTIEVGTNVIDDTKIGFADTLILKYIKHDTDVRIKVVGYEYDGFANELKHVVLGQPKNTSSSTIGNTITNLVNNVVDPVDRKTTIAMNSADGKSTVFHGTADPNTLNLNAKENDTYFRTNGSEKEIWRFTGTLWELVMDTSDTTKNADAIAEQQQAVEEAKQVADEAVEQIDTAVANAGFTSLDDTIQNMNQITMDAEQSAQQSITDASNAYDLAQTSIGEAQTAQANSLTALGKADNALEGVSNLDVRVDDVEAELELKADNTFMTEDGELITLSNAITFNANRFSSDMSRIESRVNSLAGAQNVLLNSHFKEKGKNWAVQTGTPIYDGETVILNGLTEIYQTSIDIDIGINAMFETRVKGTGTLVVRFGSGNEGIEVDVDETEFKDLHFVIEISGNRNIIIGSISGNLEIDWVKLSTSQTETGWTPAIADTLTTAEVAVFRNEYDEYADRTERRLTAIDSEGGSLDVLSNEIITTAEQVTTDMTALINTKVGDEEFSEFYQNEYLETAQEVSRKISLSDIEVGGRNLVLNTGGKLYRTFGGGATLSEVDRATRLDWTGNLQTSMGEKLSVPLIVGETYTLTFEARGTISPRIELLIITSSGANFNFSDSLGDGVVTEEFKKYTATFKFTGSPSDRLFIGGRGPVGTWLEVKDSTVKLEKGNKATDWTPAPEDTDAKIDYIETEWTQTFDTFEQTITGPNGINTQLQTLENSLSAISDPVTGRLTIAEQSLNGFRNEVYNQDGSSKVTQLATGLSSVVTDLSNLEVGGVNVLKGTKDLNTDNFVRSGSIAIRQDEDIPYLRSSGSSADYYVIELESNATYTLSLDIRNFVSGSSSVLLQWFPSLTGSRTSYGWANIPNENITSEWKRFNVTFTVPTNNNFFSLGFRMADFRLFKLEKGNKATDWTPAPEDIATQSQITQLSDNINLRVEKGDVLSQINIEADRMLFQSKRLVMDADNVVFTGKAWIPSAVIGDLEADKITSGELDAGKITVVNLDANSITSNKTSFVQSAWNDASGNSVRVTGTGINTYTADNERLNIRNGRIDFYNQYSSNTATIRNLYFSQFNETGLGISVTEAHPFVIHRPDSIGTIAYFGRTVTRFYQPIELDGNNLSEVGSISPVSNQPLEINSFGSQKLIIGNTVIQSYRSIDLMNNNLNGVGRISSISTQPLQIFGHGSLRIEVGDTVVRMHRTTALNGNDLNEVGSISPVSNQPLEINSFGSQKLIIGNMVIQSFKSIDLMGNNLNGVGRISSVSTQPLSLYAHGSQRIEIGDTVIRMHRTTGFNGNNLIEVGTIDYTSDERFKSEVVDRKQDDLATIMAINYKDYYRNGQKQRGFIAQELQQIDSGLINVDNNGYLSYDGQGYVNTIGHAVQQLANKHDAVEEAVNSHADTIHKLQQELSKANRRIEELEGAI